MTEKKKDLSRIVIGPVRLSYVHFAKPDYDEDKEASYYRCQILVPRDNAEMLKKVKMAVQTAAIKKFGRDKAAKALKSPKFHTPVRDPELEDLTDEAYKGMVFFNAKSGEKQRPGYMLKNRTRLTDEEEIDKELYSGVWAYVSLSFFYFHKQTQGIAVAINNVLKDRDDERFGNRSNIEDDFSDFLEDDEFSESGEDLSDDDADFLDDGDDDLL